MNMPPPSTLIAGCGYVGRALASHLVERGHSVTGLRRSPPADTGPLWWLAADLTRPESLRNLPQNLDFVVYAASADGRSETAYRSAYVDGLRNLLDQLRKQANNPAKILLVSSTGVYDQTGGAWVDEDSPTAASGTGGVLAEGERVLLDSPLPGIVLRLGGIYGPGRRRLIDRVLAGESPIPTGEPRYTSRIHLEDIVRAIAHLLTLEQPDPLYVGVDDDPAETATVVRWMATRLGAPEPPRRDVPVTRSNKRCRNTRLRESGFEFTYPTFREGYEQVFRDLGL